MVKHKLHLLHRQNINSLYSAFKKIVPMLINETRTKLTCKLLFKTCNKQNTTFRSRTYEVIATQTGISNALSLRLRVHLKCTSSCQYIFICTASLWCIFNIPSLWRSHSGDPLVIAVNEDARFGRHHKGPHSLVDRDRRFLDLQKKTIKSILLYFMFIIWLSFFVFLIAILSEWWTFNQIYLR